MKQSSIEWLHSEYKRILGDVMVTPTQTFEIVEALYQAKEMHKQEVIDAVIYGNRKDFYDGTEQIGEQYYNETYNIKR